MDSPITVAFNRPVVPLTGVSEQAGLPQPLVITPTLTGKGEWINTSIYRFTPDEGLAASTAYSVTVAPGLADPIGNVLASPHLRLPHRRSDDRPLAARKPDQRQDRGAHLRHLLDADGSRQAPKPPSRSWMTPRKPVAGIFNWNKDGDELGLQTEPDAEFRCRLRGQGRADRKARPPARARCATTNRRAVPLHAPSSCRRIKRTDPTQRATAPSRPMAASAFEFAIADGADDLHQRHGDDPAQADAGLHLLQRDTTATCYLDFAKLPDTDYTVTLSGKVADPYGNTLGKDYVLKFRTRRLRPDPPAQRPERRWAPTTPTPTPRRWSSTATCPKSASACTRCRKTIS